MTSETSVQHQRRLTACVGSLWVEDERLSKRQFGLVYAPRMLVQQEAEFSGRLMGCRDRQQHGAPSLAGTECYPAARHAADMLRCIRRDTEREPCHPERSAAESKHDRARVPTNEGARMTIHTLAPERRTLVGTFSRALRKFQSNRA